MTSKYSIIFTTCQNEEEANSIASTLLEKKLAACIQINPIQSIYKWQGKIEKSQEIRLSIKTRHTLYKDIEHTIKELHSYEIPQIIEIPISNANLEYLSWIDEETSWSSTTENLAYSI